MTVDIDDDVLLELLLDAEGLDLQTDQIARIPHRTRAPLSFAQQRLWMASQVAPDAALYNVPSAVRLSRTPDAATLRDALAAIVQRHEALRTAFDVDLDSHEPVQIVCPPYRPQLEVWDALDEDDVMRMIRHEAARPFDLRSGRLLRALLIRLPESQSLLVATMHHIASDAWSLDVFWRELAAHCSGAVLAPLAVQYADFAAWDRERLECDALAPSIAYWRDQLEGLPEPLALPFDRARRTVPTNRGAARARQISPATSAAIRRLARAESATPFMVLLAAWQVLLHRWTGAQDIIVGSPISGRNREEVEPLIGFFVNTLPLRAILSPRSSFRELLRATRATCIDAFAHQDVPFEKLVEIAAPRRDPGIHPIFQVAFATHAQSLPSFGSPVPFPIQTSKFELLLEVEDGEAMVARLTHATDLFDASTIDRMLGHYATLLESIVANPDGRAGRAAILDARERTLVVRGFNETTSGYPRLPLKTLFEQQVARTPDRVAVIDGDRTVTYAELDARAAGIAARLRTIGAGCDSLVGIRIERSIELIAGILGIVKAGGAYVPLDASYPEERVRFMVEDSAMEALVEADGKITPFHRAQRTSRLRSASSLAYVIYTSGSTGRPKGVAVPQSAVARLVFNTNYVAFGPDERFAQISNSSFDAATFEIWGALLHGAALVIIPRETVLSAPAFAEALRTSGATAMFITSALFTQHVREIPDMFATMRHVIVGGDALDAKAVAACLAAGPPQRLLNGYGPTESTTFAAWHLIEHVNGATVPIGKPLANTTLYVLDAELQPVPIGVVGELFIGGDGLARGYHGRPALTAERFVPDPFGAPGARLYRTGDLVRFLGDGAIEFLGRRDDQVKIRGFRIELGEIEAVLRSIDGVADACVVVREHDGDKRLVAYLVGDAEQAREVLRTKLPDYMVPAAFVGMGALPLNANGKLDRRALPEPSFAEPALDDAPVSATEAEIARIWCDVLGADVIGIHQNFFDAGGHSLLAMRVVSRVRSALGIELPLRAMFDAPTVAGMAARASALMSDLRVPPPTTLREEFDI